MTLEQELAIAFFAAQVELLDEERTKSTLVEIYISMVHMDAHYKALLKEKWGIEQSFKDR